MHTEHEICQGGEEFESVSAESGIDSDPYGFLEAGGRTGFSVEAADLEAAETELAELSADEVSQAEDELVMLLDEAEAEGESGVSLDDVLALAIDHPGLKVTFSY